MPYKDKTETQYKNDYAREKYDRIILQVPKGQRESIREYAKMAGESVNMFIYKAIIERIARIESEQNRE